MNCYDYIKEVLQGYNANELIFASEMFSEKLHGKVTEMAYYKTLERIEKSGELIKISKGIYHLPLVSKYGIVPISTAEIVDTFTSNNSGTVVGYSLYNSLNLTTQVPKTINVISSSLENQTKNIKNVCIKRVSIYFSNEIKKMIHALEVLQDFYNIEDINYPAFISFVKEIAEEYDDKTFEDVIRTINYKKSTISFLQEILNYFDKENNLHKYLSDLSVYKHPTMEEIYEIAQLQNKLTFAKKEK